MEACVLYFSRTGNTKRLAEAIAASIHSPAFDISTTDPSVVEKFDTVIFGTPVNGLMPAPEAMAYIRRLPTATGKRSIIFCTYRLAKLFTLKTLAKKMNEKGYSSILCISMKDVQPDTDFSDVIREVRTSLNC